MSSFDELQKLHRRKTQQARHQREDNQLCQYTDPNDTLEVPCGKKSLHKCWHCGKWLCKEHSHYVSAYDYKVSKL